MNLTERWSGLRERDRSRAVDTCEIDRARLFNLPEFDLVRGLMHLLVLPWIIYAIVSQPQGNALYINDAPNAVTRYQLGQSYGLLAHSHSEWEELEVGQVLYADGEAFRVTEFHLLDVQSVYRFRDENGQSLSTDDVLNRFFGDPNGLTLMTCLGTNQRLFVMAKKLDSP